MSITTNHLVLNESQPDLQGLQPFLPIISAQYLVNPRSSHSQSGNEVIERDRVGKQNPNLKLIQQHAKMVVIR